MTLQDIRSIGAPILLALTIVSAVSMSGRLYKDGVDAEKAQAAAFKSSAVACVLEGETPIY